MTATINKEMVRGVYLTNDIELAEVLLSNAVKACVEDPVPEIRTPGKTLKKWFIEILNHHKTGASNGPAEGLNLLIKKIKRVGHGYTNFTNYRLRILLYAGGCDWTKLATPTN